MKTRIAAMLCVLVLGGCLEEEDDDSWEGGLDSTTEEETISCPTLIVENRGQETALLELWYTHAGRTTYREVTLPAGNNFRQTYPDLGTVKLIAGRLRDGLLLVQETFEKADFPNNLLRIALSP